jgi:L-threonine kinase
MTIVARCPASCGELIQGWISGSEKLISCPIDWYSEVSISQRKMDTNERPNMRKALIKTLEHLGVETELSQELYISLKSTVPVAKGMASSTADIAATIAATARWLNKPLTVKEISDLCISIEPTDSTFFSQLTLYDHLKGLHHQPLGNAPSIDILILEPLSVLTTASYRRKHHQSKLKDASKTLEKASKKIEEGCQKQSPRLIGEATTLSAIENQKILPKPGFNKLLHLLDKSDLYGINVAHSGTVMGLLMNRDKYDPDKILAQLKFCGITEMYPHQHWAKLISGGIK